MKKTVLIAFSLVMVSIGLNAQMPETFPLEDGDIEKFIKTYKPLTKDLEALGEEYEDVQDYTLLQSIAANEKVINVFEKYGWDERWTGKWATIMLGYSAVKMDAELSKMSAEEREYYNKYYASSANPLMEMVSNADRDKIKSKISELDKLFEQE